MTDEYTKALEYVDSQIRVHHLALLTAPDNALSVSVLPELLTIRKALEMASLTHTKWLEYEPENFIGRKPPDKPGE